MPVFDSITKPTLLLDRERCVANIRAMAEKAHRLRVRFRPHFKTHQSAVIGAWFRPYGVEAITVSSVDMAAYFAAQGWDDITIAFPANPRQVGEIDALAGSVRLGLLFESQEAVHRLDGGLTSQAEAWIKVDVGAGRTGVPWERGEEVVALARALRATRHLSFRGLLTHAGHTYHAAGPGEIKRIYAESVARLSALREALQAVGIAGVELSYGDTPACRTVDDFIGLDEIRPGNFVLYDAMQLALGVCREEEIATAVACPVVALHPEREQAVIYGGAIHLSKEALATPDGPVYGYAALTEGAGWGRRMEGAQVVSLSQEHGLVHMRREDLRRLAVGDLLVILPIHSCLTVDLMGHYRTLEGASIATHGKFTSTMW